MPDIRDGLTRTERLVLHELDRLQKERDGRSVPTALLYGRICDRVDIRPDELQELLRKLGAAG